MFWFWCVNIINGFHLLNCDYREKTNIVYSVFLSTRVTWISVFNWDKCQSGQMDVYSGLTRGNEMMLTWREEQTREIMKGRWERNISVRKNMRKCWKKSKYQMFQPKYQKLQYELNISNILVNEKWCAVNKRAFGYFTKNKEKSFFKIKKNCLYTIKILFNLNKCTFASKINKCFNLI